MSTGEFVELNKEKPVNKTKIWFANDILGYNIGE